MQEVIVMLFAPIIVVLLLVIMAERIAYAVQWIAELVRSML
jgi:hypothetical protein